nr:terpene cyclase [Aspergillus striatus]
MDGYDVSQAPPEYHAVKPLVDSLILGMGLGWMINYLGMVYQSFREETYGMAIIPLCCNIAWEIVYAVIYPSKDSHERGVFFGGLIINLAIIYAAIRFSPNEWAHAPLVRDNLRWIFLVGILVFLTGHLALVAEMGFSLAYLWSAAFCQVVLSLGGLCQLLCRNRTRGASYLLWGSRTFGTFSGVVALFIRWKYWPESFEWLNSPLMLWCLTVSLLFDGSYGVCFWYVKRSEEMLLAQRKER